MLSDDQRQRCVEALVQAAVKKYGKLKTRKVRPALDQLVLSIFYRLTSVRRATRALRELKRSLVDWNELRVSSVEEVISHLSSAEWARVGARQIEEVVSRLFELRNEVSLEFLRDEMPPAQARRFLRELPGVDRELANEVLLLSLGVAVFPCSEQIARTCHRLGLLDSEQPLANNQRVLTKTFDPQYYAVLHRFLFDTASRYCLAESPLCSECVLREHCVSAR